jgi:hypothetical protein
LVLSIWDRKYTELFLMGNFQMAGETKINGMGLLHDIRQQWGLLGTRQKKTKCK